MGKTTRGIVACVLLAVVCAFASVFPAFAEERDDSDAQIVLVAGSEDPNATNEITEILKGESYRGSEPLDNDQLFAGYVDVKLGIADTPSNLRKRRSNLDDVNSVLYNELRKEIGKVAAGDRSSTEIRIPANDVYPNKSSWTAEELGVDSIVENGEITEAAQDALSKKLGINLSAIVNALLADCPYDLYWYDKVSGVVLGQSIGAFGSGDELTLYIKELTFSFSVAQGYAAGQYQVDTSNAQRVQHAVAKATSIVGEYANDADSEKLAAYCEAICGLVAYDNDAANDDATPYGDSWQIISVFDEDESTNVVCEGYSKAFKYLCDLTAFEGNISCISVTGTMSGGTGAGRHMWNIVNLDDGQNYLVDVTNCDENTIGYSNQLFLVEPSGGSFYDGYDFSCSSGTIHYEYDTDTFVTFSAEELLFGSEEMGVGTECGGQAHSYGDWTVTKAPTCTEPGSKEKSCAACGNKVAEGIPALGHAWSKTYTVDVPATCSAEGSESIHCTRCGSHKDGSNRAVGKTAHQWVAGKVTVQPTYSATGKRTYSCKNCGATKSETIPALTRTSLSTAVISGLASKTYTGKALTQSPTVKVGTTVLRNGTDYSLTYSNNINAGTATVVVTGEGKYSGTKKATFKINPASVTAASLAKTKATYNGKVQKPTVKAVSAGTLALPSSGYTVKYSNAKSNTVGTYTVTVTGKGNFAGSKTLTYKITRATNKAKVAKRSIKRTFVASMLKKKSQYVALPKVTSTFGIAKWKVIAKDKNGVLGLKKGSIKVKAAAKKGTYTIKLKAYVTANKNYRAVNTKVVTVSVTIN